MLTGNGLNNIVRGLGGNDRAFGQSAVQFQRLINPVTNPLDTGELGYLPIAGTSRFLIAINTDGDAEHESQYNVNFQPVEGDFIR